MPQCQEKVFSAFCLHNRLIFIAIALASALIPMLIFYVIAWIVIPTQPTSSLKEDRAPGA